MRTIWTMAIKDLRVLSRDKGAVFFILAFPILMGIFFGVVMGGPSGSGGKGNAMKLAVVDEDKSPMSEKFVKQLDANDSCDILLMDRSEAMDQVRKGKITGMIALPDGFGETAGIVWQDPPEIQVGMDPSRMAESAMAQGFIMQAMGNMIGDRMFDPVQNREMVDELQGQLKLAEAAGITDPNFKTVVNSLDSLFDSLNKMDEASDSSKSTNDSGIDKADNADGDASEERKYASDSATEQEEPKTPKESNANRPSLQFANITSIDVTRKVEKGSQAELLQRVRSKWDLTFPQSMVWGILGCVASFAISIVRERVRGTYQRLEVAPLLKTQIVAGKGLACFLAVVMVLTFLTAVGYFLGLRPRNPIMLLVAAVTISFCFVGIMLVISVLGKTEEAVGGAGWGINMVMAMFGGGMIPLMFLPKSIQAFSNFSPIKWAVLALEGAIWRGFTVAEMATPLLILFCVGAACIAIGSWRLSVE